MHIIGVVFLPLFIYIHIIPCILLYNMFTYDVILVCHSVYVRF